MQDLKLYIDKLIISKPGKNCAICTGSIIRVKYLIQSQNLVESNVPPITRQLGTIRSQPDYWTDWIVGKIWLVACAVIQSMYYTPALQASTAVSAVEPAIPVGFLLQLVNANRACELTARITSGSNNGLAKAQGKQNLKNQKLSM